MYVIKMEQDKTLVTTIHSTIYQGETKADRLFFILPREYDDINFADCTLLLQYILPNSVGHSEELRMLPSAYKNEHYQYGLDINSKLTSVAGKIRLWLKAIDIHNEIILISKETILEISSTKDIVDYFPPAALSQIDRLTLDVSRLDRDKADNITYDSDSKDIQLASNGLPIGDAINMISIIQDSGVIEFGDDVLPRSEEGDDNDVIHF